MGETEEVFISVNYMRSSLLLNTGSFQAEKSFLRLLLYIHVLKEIDLDVFVDFTHTKTASSSLYASKHLHKNDKLRDGYDTGVNETLRNLFYFVLFGELVFVGRFIFRLGTNARCLPVLCVHQCSAHFKVSFSFKDSQKKYRYKCWKFLNKFVIIVLVRASGHMSCHVT